MQMTKEKLIEELELRSAFISQDKLFEAYQYGFDDGGEERWQSGYDEGYEDGREIGHDEGLDEARNSF